MSQAILTLNAGSSSLKFSLFTFDEALTLLAEGRVTNISERRAGSSEDEQARHPNRRQSAKSKKLCIEPPVFKAKKANGGASESITLSADATHEEALDVVLKWLKKNGNASWKFSTVAHRIVHGGKKYDAPALLTPDVIAFLDTLCPLAPLHQSHNLACAKILAEKNPEMVQYGCFDTAFHARRDKVFSSYALPADIREKGVRRYGFHGLSYEWIAQCLRHDHPKLAKGRIVVAHLGNGASLCAMRDGKSVDTTMGMSTLEGLPMGTRCGNIDASAILYMQRNLGFSVDEVESILYQDSGLKGLSGISNDVKTLSESDKESARFALKYFVVKTSQLIAAMAAAIGGMDGLVFTGGIGENAENIRSAILERLAFLSPFETHIIPANEERGMAQSVYKCIAKDIAA